MYIPAHFEERDVTVLHRFVRAHPLGALVTVAGGRIDADHIPFLLDADPPPLGTLHGHVARANPLWRDRDRHAEVLVIFHGADAFISPSWYPSKEQTSKVVPTWNYVVVHARGRLRVIDEAGWVRAHVEALTREHEGRRTAPWHVSDAPADYVATLTTAIVGLEIPISTLTGKWKASQNRAANDRAGVVDGLTREGTPPAMEMAEIVRRAGGKA